MSADDYVDSVLEVGVRRELSTSALRAAVHSAAQGEKVFFVAPDHELRAQRFRDARGLSIDAQRRVVAGARRERIEYQYGGWIRFITRRQADLVRGIEYTMVLHDSHY